MAQRTVRVLRAFNGIGRDQDAAEKSRYITPDNAASAEEFLTEKEFNYRVEQGFISVEETREPEPLSFQTPEERQAEVVPVEGTRTPARTRRGAPVTE